MSNTAVFLYANDVLAGKISLDSVPAELFDAVESVMHAMNA